MLNRNEAIKANKLKRVKAVADIVLNHYEAGNQSKSIAQIYKQYVLPIYPMGERTFWRYMGIAQNELGYEFENNYIEQDCKFTKLLPETKELIKTIADIVLKINTKGKTRKEIFVQNQDFILSQVSVSYHSFSKYLKIAEVYMGYKFDFKEHTRVKERRIAQKTNYILNFK